MIALLKGVSTSLLNFKQKLTSCKFANYEVASPWATQKASLPRLHKLFVFQGLIPYYHDQSLGLLLGLD